MLTPYIEIGEVLRPHGVQGMVKVRPDTDAPRQFEALETVWVAEGGAYRELPVCDASFREGFVYLRLNGASSRDEAEKQRGWMLYVDRAHAKPLEENEWFICDLIGCEVRTEDGERLGTVTDVLQPGANDVFVIQTPRGELLAPVLRQLISSVDVEGRLIVLLRGRLREVAVFP